LNPLGLQQQHAERGRQVCVPIERAGEKDDFGIVVGGLECGEMESVDD